MGLDTPSLCPEHGMPSNRTSCSKCNAAYMRNYLRLRRRNDPAKELCVRARKRAERLGLPYSLDPRRLIIPAQCPVLGIPLISGGKRSIYSPSLDRIIPSLGYIHGNVRVISDHANRLKGDRSSQDLLSLSINGREDLRDSYRRVHAYVEREALLAVAKAQFACPRRRKGDWFAIVRFLECVSLTGRLDDWPA